MGTDFKRVAKVVLMLSLTSFFLGCAEFTLESNLGNFSSLSSNLTLTAAPRFDFLGNPVASVGEIISYSLFIPGSTTVRLDETDIEIVHQTSPGVCTITVFNGNTVNPSFNISCAAAVGSLVFRVGPDVGLNSEGVSSEASSFVGVLFEL